MTTSQRLATGSATTELTLLTPLLLALMLLVVLAGRLMTAENELVGTARDAARAASMRASVDDARDAAIGAADRSMRSGACAAHRVDVQLDELPDGSVAPGSTVRVRVECDVALGDLALIRVPGRRTLSATGYEVIDRYRSVR